MWALGDGWGIFGPEVCTRTQDAQDETACLVCPSQFMDLCGLT